MAGQIASKGLDAAGFEELYRRMEKPLFNVVYRWLWDSQEASEVVQDAFVRLWGMHGKVRVEKVEPLVFRIALNLASRRRRWRRTWRFLSLDVRTEPSWQGDPAAYRAIERRERQRLVRAAVESLPEKMRAVVMLCEFSDMSYAQVASTLGIPEGTVASRRHVALARLRRFIEHRSVLEDG